jgi:ubiquinone/menaquinone biosynthesis C-methylase UbiE
VDIDEEAIRRLSRKAATEDLKNLTLRVGEAENTVLCEACGDIVFFSIVLHDFNNVTEVLHNSKRMLRPTGRLVDLDWKKESMPLGPPYRIRFSEKKATKLIRSAGFEIEKTTNSGLYHYIIIGKLPSST